MVIFDNLDHISHTYLLPCLSLSFKSVSRLVKLIDDAKNRTARQQMPQSLMNELNSDSYTGTMKTAAKREVLLDALGNVPLKVRCNS